MTQEPEYRWVRGRWWRSDVDPQRYEAALRSLSRLQSYQPAVYPALEAAVIEACEKARRYSKDKDPNEVLRRWDSAALKAVKAQLNAIRRVQSFMTKYPKQAGYALAHVHLKHFNNRVRPGSRTASSELSIKENKTLPEFWVSMLSTYADVLENSPVAKRGNWLHRYQVGPLLFRKPKDAHSSRIELPETGLLFQLVLYFRRYTAGIPAFEGSATGAAMPDCGEPCYDIAAEFIEAVTGKTDKAFGTPSQVGHRLEKFLAANPGVGLADWPS